MTNPTETAAERMWSALLSRCAAHKPDEHHKVHRLVMVTHEDIRAAVRAAGLQIEINVRPLALETARLQDAPPANTLAFKTKAS